MIDKRTSGSSVDVSACPARPPQPISGAFCSIERPFARRFYSPDVCPSFAKVTGPQPAGISDRGYDARPPSLTSAIHRPQRATANPRIPACRPRVGQLNCATCTRRAPEPRKYPPCCCRSRRHPRDRPHRFAAEDHVRTHLHARPRRKTGATPDRQATGGRRRTLRSNGTSLTVNHDTALPKPRTHLHNGRHHQRLPEWCAILSRLDAAGRQYSLQHDMRDTC